MKKILLIFCAAIFVFSCQENKPTDSMTESFQSDSLHLSLKYPKNWKVLKNPNSEASIAIVKNRENEKDIYEEKIVCWVEEMPMSISDSVYLQASITQLKISNPDMMIEKKEKLKLGDHDFSSFTFNYTTDSTQFEVQNFCLVKGNRGYNFSCKAIKKEMPAHLQIFKDIISTFKPL